MTTKVTVDAHAGWPVHVTLIDKLEEGQPVETECTVAPHTTQDFYIHSTREMRVREGKVADS